MVSSSLKILTLFFAIIRSSFSNSSMELASNFISSLDEEINKFNIIIKLKKF